MAIQTARSEKKEQGGKVVLQAPKQMFPCSPWKRPHQSKYPHCSPVESPHERASFFLGDCGKDTQWSKGKVRGKEAAERNCYRLAATPHSPAPVSQGWRRRVKLSLGKRGDVRKVLFDSCLCFSLSKYI